MLELRDALNAIWHAPVATNQSEFADLFQLVKERIYSFLLIIVLGIFLLLSLLMNAGLSELARSYGWRQLGAGHALHLLVMVVSFVVMTFVFATIYKFVPDVRLSWSEATVGGAVTSVLFSLGKLLIVFYMKLAKLGAAYGAAGALIVVVLWVYYSAQVFFLGAEFTKVYAKTFNSRSVSAVP